MNTDRKIHEIAADKIAAKLNELLEGDVDAELTAHLASDEYALRVARHGDRGTPVPQVRVGSHWLDCYITRTPWGWWYSSYASKDGVDYVSIDEDEFRALLAVGRTRYDSPGEGQPEAEPRKAPPMAHTAATMLALGVGLWFTVPPAVNGMEAAAGAMDVACIRSAR